MKTRSLLIAGGVLALSIPALAQMHGGDHAPMAKMHGSDTRADLEASVKSHFAAMDGNKDGQVTPDEIKAMHAARRAERQDAHFAAMDKDSNGQISKAEFDAAHSGDQTMKHGERSAHRGAMGEKHHKGQRAGQDGPRGMMGEGGMFAMADANKDGGITLSEALTARLARFDAVDSDKNGTLSPEERMKARQARKMERKAQ